MFTSIVWFRRDLRLQDNPALKAALLTNHPVIAVYIHEPETCEWSMGAASKWWLHHSLSSLQQALRQRGSDLLIIKGDAEHELNKLCRKFNSHHVFWNRRYDPDSIENDTVIKEALLANGIEVKSFNGSLLTEPCAGLKKDGTPYRVFTPYWKSIQKRGVDLFFFTPPEKFPALPDSIASQYKQSITSLQLLPDISWTTRIEKTWQPGEAGAMTHLEEFLDEAIFHYPVERDIPFTRGTSRLSPHLHFGEISPWRISQGIQECSACNTKTGTIKATEVYQRQLAWRDFAHQLLYHFPHTANEPLDQRFKAFPWKRNYHKPLTQWKQGMTGIPIVDAGMRELRQTGWMHNRVRMITASLLCKNLLIPWQEGAKWFWDTLVDADLANNTMGWQWTAGCGADAAPFFRIFNPVRQGERFDPQGHYVRNWIPELAALPNKWIHHPWDAPQEILDQAHVLPGKNYPNPIVDLSESRTRALAIWNELKNTRQHNN